MPDKPPPSPPPRGQRWKSTDAARAGVPGRTGSRRRKQALVLLTIILVLAGAAAGWLFFLGHFKEPYFVSIPVTEYTAGQLPVNAFAEQDSDALLEDFGAAHRSKAFEIQERRRLAEELQALREQSDRPVVFHLRSLALTRGNQVFLLPGTASPDDPDSWLPLSEVLQGMEECPAPQRLLILDIMQPIADARLGTLVDDVARRVEAELEEREKAGRLPYLVLCACSGDQVSLVSEDLGHSVFGHYLDEGLRGHADGYNPEGKAHGSVRARELAEFVERHVDRWADRNRGTRQTPRLFGTGADFDLVRLPEGKPLADRDAASPPVYPEWLRNGWQKRDGWLADETYRVVPQAFRKLEVRLQRAEQRWRGGAAEATLRRGVEQGLDDFQTQATTAKRLLPAPPRASSLTAARKRDVKPDAEAGKLLRQYLALGDGPPPKPEELVKAKAAVLDKLKSQPEDQQAITVLDEAAALVTPGVDKLRLLDALLADAALQPAPRFAETLLLRRLCELKKGKVRDDDKRWAAVMLQALETSKQAEKAAACDPLALPWVRQALADAEKRRLKLEGGLFEAPYTSDAEDIAKELEVLAKAFQALAEQSRWIETAYRELDEALTLLPGFEPYLASRPEADARDLKAWDRAATAARNLDRRLAQTKPESAVVDELKDLVRELHAALKGLRDGLGRSAVVAETVTPVAFQDMEAALRSPRLSAKEREELWKGCRRAAQRWNEDTETLDRREESSHERAERPARAEAAAGQRMLERGERRARLSLGLLELAGFTRTAAVRAALEQAQRDGSAQGWQAAAAGLRDAWATGLPEQCRLELSKDRRTADRISRILHPSDWEEKVDAGGQRNLTAQMQRETAVAYWKWLAERYRAEGKAHPDAPAYAITFFEQAADDAETAARRPAR